MAKRKPITKKPAKKLKRTARRQPIFVVPQFSLPSLPTLLERVNATLTPLKNALESSSYQTVSSKTLPGLIPTSFPKISFPKVSLPRVKPPQITLPTLPTLPKLPKFSQLSFQSTKKKAKKKPSKGIKLVFPKIPKITLPSFEFPPYSQLSRTITVGNQKSGVIFEAKTKQASKKIKPAKVAQVKPSKLQKKWLKFKKKIAVSVQNRLKKTKKRVIKDLQALRKWTIAVARKLMYPFWAIVRFYPWHLLLTIIVTSVVIGSYYFVYLTIFKDLPSAMELTQKPSAVTTKILDRNGEVLFSIYKDENRTVIPLSEMPESLKKATIAIEDKEFYQHHGFSVRGIIRAFLANTQGEIVQGGSTITQQLVKNRLLSPEKTWQRKIKEVVLAVIVDGTYSKDQILEMYLNEVAYGGSIYGVEEAAQQYFDKHAAELTLAESALLAGLPAAPSAYSPFGPTPELAFVRQEEVLRRMVDDGYISEEQAASAKQEVLNFRANRVEIKAPHFVMYVRKLLAEKFGEQLITEGGLEVKTTLDLDLHNKTQEAVTKELEQLQRLRINNGAALVTNPGTGEVLAMVGSKDYFDFANDGQVNVTLRPRQPGSSIKPLTYATAFEHGKNPSSVEDDSPVVYQIPGSKPYAPKNYDGKFHGRVTLRESLGSSYNIPAVKLLAWLGLDTVIAKGQEMGITTWVDKTMYGLSLTLGGGEVLMIDMVKLYGTFANQGYTVDINPILEVKNYKGEVLYHNECALDGVCAKRKTLDSRVAYYITSILKDNNARTPAFGARSVLVIPNQEVAVKTGTTNNLKDNWTIGYTTDRVVATWVGNNDGSPMSYVASGVTGASPIWNNIMRLTLDDEKPHVFAGPEGMVKVQICARTGTLSCQGCPSVREEYFIPGTEPKVACNPAQFRPKPNPTATPDPNRDQILDGIFTN